MTIYYSINLYFTKILSNKFLHIWTTKTTFINVVHIFDNYLSNMFMCLSNLYQIINWKIKLRILEKKNEEQDWTIIDNVDEE